MSISRTWPAHALVLACVVPMVAFLHRSAAAQTIDTELCGVNGTVYSIARIGQTLYVGGGFSTAGPCTGGGVPLDRVTGAPRRPFPRVTGVVCAVVSDGSGGWFIGGHFTAVGGLARSNIAHVLADGSVAPWAPAVIGTGLRLRDPYLEFRPAGVNALVLRRRTLYVGGRFSSIGGRARSHIAALDAETAHVSDWAPEADDEVRCLALRGNVLYAGGEFGSIGSATRVGLAAVEIATGRATPWDPNPAPGRIRAIVTDGEIVYVGGDFDQVGGAVHNSVAALDAHTGRALPWDAALGPTRSYIAHGSWTWPYVAALAVRGRTVYIGGWFEEAGGAPRRVLAAVDACTGRAEGFDANVQGGTVSGLAVHGHTIYATGALYNIGGAVRPNVAALDVRTGHATEWNPRADGPARTITVEGDAVFIGGDFSSVYDWQVRSGLAALDLKTGALLPWDARVDGGIYSIAAMGNTLYMVGGFRSVGGEARGNIAAVDATTGAVLPWNPGSAGSAYPMVPRIAAQNGVVYVAGYFVATGSPTWTGFAALDGVSGAELPWTMPLAPDGLAESVLPAGDTVYVCGDFRRLGGQRRTGFAALDAATGNLLSWAPTLAVAPGCNTLFPDVMALNGGTLYIAGSLGAVNGAPRSDLAAVDARTGATLPWDPQAAGEYPAANVIHVTALAAHGNTVWAGGVFASVGGLPRPYMAAIDATTGVPTSWEPQPDGEVDALLASDEVLYVGGTFRALGTTPRSGLAAVRFVPASARVARYADPAPVPGGRTALDVSPNPARTTATIRFIQHAAGQSRLVVYDVQGRRMASLLDGASLPAGEHVVTVPIAGWKPGVYLCHLDAAGVMLTRKLVVATR